MMATKRSPASTVYTDQIQYIVVGSSFPNPSNDREAISGTTRNSIRLSLSSQIYAHMCIDRIANPTWDAVEAKRAKELATIAFDLTEIYLQKLDEQESFRTKPGNNNK
jgi:hypothetical protein